MVPGAPAMYSFAGFPFEMTMLNVAFTNDVPTIEPFTVALTSLTVTTCVAAFGAPHDNALAVATPSDAV